MREQNAKAIRIQEKKNQNKIIKEYLFSVNKKSLWERLVFCYYIIIKKGGCK